MISREQGRQGGGILADAMGLGKTVSIIALILACPLPGFDKFRQILGWNPDPSMGTVNNGVNLIVAPASLLQQWQKEIETKTSPKLKVLRYDALGKIGVTASCLYRYQAILVSYETLLSDYNKKVLAAYPLPII